MTKSVHFPCLCLQTASYIHTFLFLLNLLPQTDLIFCLAFYVRNTHHVIWVKQKSPLFLFPYTVWIEGLCKKPCQLWNGKAGNFFAYMEIILIQTDSHYERYKGHSIASWVQNTPKLTHLPLGLSLHSTKHIRVLCLQCYNAVLSESW